MGVQSLNQEDPLEEESETHYSILTLKIPQTEKPGRLQSMGRKEADKTGQQSTHKSICYQVSSIWNQKILGKQ